MASLIVSPVRGIEAARSFAERSPTCFTALLQNIPVVRLASSRLTFNTLQHRLCRHSRGQSQANVWEKGDIQVIDHPSILWLRCIGKLVTYRTHHAIAIVCFIARDIAASIPFEWMQAVSETSSQALSEHYIHALLLVYFASQNRPLVATR